ncbi:MAG: electron transfer flavoprotein subunit alpha/FixB family protein [Anaerolineae bacterium]|nr:electron transfer flavoprotein subunit alpha/FixB family protein [Anaerolineae bacterium]
MNTLVWLEQFRGVARAISWEALGAARHLGGKVVAAILGSGVEKVAQEAIARGADTVYLADDPTLAAYRTDPYVATLKSIVAQAKPDAFLIGATARGRDLAAALAAELDTGLAADCLDLSVDGSGALHATRPVYAGNLLATITFSEKRPQMATLRARAFPAAEADANRPSEIVRVPAALPEDQIGVKVLEFQAEEGKVSLADARIVVSGGRAVRGPEGFALVRELAEVLGGALGASRAAVDAGWIPYAYQVGQTGRTVRPDLYIACGISGAVQHLAGMGSAKVIVAINKDADAPIFKVAKYGIVGDIFEVVPALTAEFKKRLGK